MLQTAIDDDFIPNFDRKLLLKQLLKLPLSTLCDLTINWTSKFGNSSNKNIDSLQGILEHYKRKKVRRRVVASRILLEYWPLGLNLYQIAQIDCHLLIHKPNNYYWNSATAWKANNEKALLIINPDKFIKNLKEDLSKFYLSNIYIFKHPELPLIICRIQLFDFNNMFLTALPERNPDGKNDIQSIELDVRTYQERELTSRRPFYVAFPENSSIVIHSSDSDSYAKLILQSVQKTLSERVPVLLKPNEDTPVRSLDAMNVINGISRYSQAFGPWKNYADASFDISPFSKPNEHISINGKRIIINDDDDKSANSSNVIKRIKLENNMLKFKGTKEGVRKINIEKSISERNKTGGLLSDIDVTTNKNKYPSPYTSLIPISKVEFTMINTIEESQEDVAIKFKLKGNDIFGGLHQLCDQELIDVSKVPGWLAGENGISSGKIINGDFQKEFKRKRGGLLQ
ncbi:hypothetical protein Kpol_1031p77 [Vanderwaltozyma polyspora DSM 70294]|uniref:Chl4p n=1 Tax=Vanderwaltozyma polyspora (strain ATCC 22028 / DSM 70294 / BCRC 21397 / CBS 2163 / NBRC 10782 / NRRL Y-8283 / UCD 57-17) TaxID=436907 RepID=A7TI07_VANPO|nr:uncharacterized protein Kpol_1031p77 [Vanderwaltozyma polyspora DSM 70294]EDO18169.1 hypothetical protein Kpol_1031p77 [Vanderwaltozyma polyspora DSM 70294]